MRQPSIFEALGGDRRRRESATPLEVVDLFCGAGGFSEGARQAGCRVAFACDSDPHAVACYRANHPQVDCRLLTLPVASLPLPEDGRAWHLHGSPPCTMFSTMRSHYARETSVSESLVRWFLNLVLESSCASWTLEEVAASELVQLLEEYRRRAPGRVAFASVDCSLLGVPQTRTRLIAGSPHVVAGLQRACCSSLVRSVRDAVPDVRAKLIGNSKRWGIQKLRSNRRPGQTKYVYYTLDRPDQHTRPVDQPSFTLMARGNAVWVMVTRDGERLEARLTKEEYAALQTFPATYVWRERTTLARHLIGNAVPPLVAWRVMELAQALVSP